MFTIQDTNGRYVDKYSIWYEKETGEWCYRSKGGYKFDSNMRDSDTGVILCKDIDEAEKVIENLNANLHKVKVLTDFKILKIS